MNVQRDVIDNGHFGPVHCLDSAETRAARDGRYLDTVSQGILNIRRLGEKDQVSRSLQDAVADLAAEAMPPDLKRAAA